MKTAVAAPPEPPYDEMLDFIDSLTFIGLLDLVLRLRLMLIRKIAEEGGP